MRNKKKLIICLMAVGSNILQATASPRVDYLQERLHQAKSVEMQAKFKAEAEERRYKSTRSARKSIERELKALIKRERREYEQAQKAYRASQLRVGDMMAGDMSAPTSIRWRGL